MNFPQTPKFFWAKVLATLILLLPWTVGAETLTGPTYQIEDATIDAGGENSNSASYRSVDAIGDQSDSGSASTNYRSLLGFIWPAYPGVPNAPTLTNTGGTLYNALDFKLSSSGNPGDNSDDTTYAIAISTDNFVTTYFVQTDDTVGTTQAWQTFTNWGGTTGERITGLSPSTTYKIKVKASFGSGSDAANTETAYSVAASAATTAPSLSITFAGVSSGTTIGGVTTTTTSTTNAIAYGSLPVNSPRTAAHQVTVTTNATAGYATTVQENNDLSTTSGSQISPVSATNASPAAWPGGITTGAFGYHTTDNSLCTGTSGRFSSSDTYAKFITSPEEVACNTGPATSETTTLIFKLEIGSIQPNGDYSNKVTYITTAQF